MIHPVILCGGSGTRLWPLSRRDYPKQFSPLFNDDSLFQATVRRFSGPDFAQPVILSQSDFRFLVAEQLSATGVTQATILLEPEARNTAPAILCAALHLAARDQGDALMAVAPSDHVIHDEAAFHAALTAAIPAAHSGRMITFGLPPDRAETGYGYLELAEAPGDFTPRVTDVLRFVEKPGAEAAEAMVASGRYLWNAGIFLFRVSTLIQAYERLAPEMIAPARAAMAEAYPDLGFLRLGEAAFARIPEGSLDYAIMEKAGDVATVPLACGWSDLGAWDAVWREKDTAGSGLVTAGAVTAIDCAGSLLQSGEDGPRLVGIGLRDLAVVAMRDAVLVTAMGDVQAVRQAVQEMKAAGACEADTFPRSYRPWGWYETLARDARFQVKRIMVPPGRQLSLQSHLHRSEHWIVVKGTARVSIGGEERLISENQSVYIPVGARHRLENPGKVDLHLIEVQTGAYLGEDDITRYEDVYNRE
ncbi:MAG: mannose-1-phosphate guanylyltransferase/mannose-6-phosphate isomerase [Qingshengfaniella sp.]